LKVCRAITQMLSGVILKQIIYTDNSAGWRATVGCQSKSQGTRHHLELIALVYIVGVKIFKRYCNIALSIRPLP